eukprot:1157640-Pelagomonas_calceolata.AAC.10
MQSCLCARILPPSAGEPNGPCRSKLRQLHYYLLPSSLRSGEGLYDEDTVCLLQSLDVFGPQYLPPGTHVEAVTDIKLYCLLRNEYDTLPPQTLKVRACWAHLVLSPCPGHTSSLPESSAVLGRAGGSNACASGIEHVDGFTLLRRPLFKGLLEESQVFLSQYSAGKESGLQRIDAARQRPSYGAYQYKVRSISKLRHPRPSRNLPLGFVPSDICEKQGSSSPWDWLGLHPKVFLTALGKIVIHSKVKKPSPNNKEREVGQERERRPLTHVQPACSQPAIAVSLTLCKSRIKRRPALLLAACSGMAACNKLLGCVATPHDHAGEDQAAPPPNPAPLPNPHSRPLSFRSPSLPQRDGLLVEWSSTSALSLGSL